uniref:protein HEATR9-like n=1 Tax=Pristiophorus japonicus TaxID=55135 RepID=UPI00398EEF99
MSEKELLSESASISQLEYSNISLFEKKEELRFFKEVLPPLPARWYGGKEDPESIEQVPHMVSQCRVRCATRNSKARLVEDQRKKKLKHDYYMRRFRVTAYAVLLSVIRVNKGPKPVYPQHQSSKWQRLMHLIKSLNSAVVLERRDAAKALQCLQCTNTEIISALYTTLQTDEDCVVKYEAAKALVTLGYWEEEVVLALIHIMNMAPKQLLEDIIVTVRRSLRDWTIKPSHQRPEIKAKEKLVPVLTSCMKGLHCKDIVPVQAAACLCYLNSDDQEEAIDYVMSYLHEGDSYQKKQALETVLRFLGIHKPFPIQVLLDQLQTSPVYKHRLKALDLLVVIGESHIKMAGLYQTVFEALKEKLWNDPVVAVCRRAALVVNLLNMKTAMWEDVEKQLAGNDEELRSRAVISLKVLGLPSRRVFQLLLEMAELDASQHVRFQGYCRYPAAVLTEETDKEEMTTEEDSQGGQRDGEKKDGDTEGQKPRSWWIALWDTQTREDTAEAAVSIYNKPVAA